MEGGGAAAAAPSEGLRQAQAPSQGQVGAAEPPERAAADPELWQELCKAKHECSVAAGTISSLQRQLEIQESQLRKIQSEKETLQKKLRKQENQLQAMSAKFCSLTEQKHEELMLMIEKENCSLLQAVTEQESEVAKQNKLISELQGTVRDLQAELLTNQHHIRKQQQAQEAIQREAETLQHRLLQTQVALQRITSRSERYRSKIIQATFSTAGIQPPQAELTDEEVLEAMQVCGSASGSWQGTDEVREHSAVLLST
ncbi:coiled-coil domain-containing protein 27 isoform X1 [Falco rusticolus]|uniref:coiled-coil domain-containing protein 27 isoform X1 n=1 Tax=Falco rusticolus TaxID=120794 RepID=UPI0018869F1A|nr:coiled-coil domain-containing protein 27 isoform X1 [Falco rusticolus]